MATSLLNLVQSVMTELNFPAPASVIGNNTQTVQQVLALLKRAGKELVKEYEWRFLQKEYRFYTNAISATANVVQGSQTITNVSNTTGLTTNFALNPQNLFNQDTLVTAINGNTVTISQPALQTLSNASIQFSQQIYPLPADYEAMVNRTHWDKSKRWEMLGPETPQQWQWLKSGYISTGPRLRWRIIGNFFELWPNVTSASFGGNTAGEYLGFEYRSNSTITSAMGVAQTDYLADTDLNLLDEMILVCLTKKKYFEIKGFDTEALTQDYMRMLAIAKANDKGAPILSFSPSPSEVLLGWQNIPDSGFGS